MFEALLILGAYLIGSIPFGLAIGKVIYHIDVRQHGSGNVGATNVWRVLGPKPGLSAFVLDLFKGLIPILAARRFFGYDPWLIVGTGLAAVIGHNYSPFLKFKGGKGVATSLGVAFGLSWKAAVAGFVVWGILLAAFGYVSLGSIISAPVAGFLIWFFNGKALPFGLFGLMVAIVVIFSHRGNIARLRAGTEPKVDRNKWIPQWLRRR